MQGLQGRGSFWGCAFVRCGSMPGAACRVNLRKLLYVNVQRVRGGLVLKAHRLLNHSTLGSRSMKKKRSDRQELLKIKDTLRP